MRCVFVVILMLIAPPTYGADDAPKASGTLAGKRVRFSEEGVAEGVKATIGLLESCHDASEGTEADFEAAQATDHIRIVFAKPIKVSGGSVEVSELVLTQPLSTGVFWLRSGDKVLRRTKFEAAKQAAFEAWLRQARPTD